MVRLLSGVGAIVLAGLCWEPSTAAAEELCSEARDVSEGDSLYCVREDVGLIGQLDMLSTQTARLSIRQLKGLECVGYGYDDLARLVGFIEIPPGESYVESCFHEGDMEAPCFEVSPIRHARITCTVPD